GTITKVADDEVTVEIAEGVRVRIVRGTIANVLAKTEPTKGGRDDKEPATAAGAKTDAGAGQTGAGARFGKMFGRK
ncbi:MAG TPA: preprotein translocase subunit YajC, partial [Arenibaculum sp.]|nr:preprotein translocase subunit YajC [Arenibaculum sp.]